MATYYGDENANYIGPYSGPNTLYGLGGNDTLEGYTDHDWLDGGNGDDWLLGWFGNDSLYGGLGNDTLLGEDNNDRLSGDDGNDVLAGGNNNDTLNGNAGNDVLYGDDNNLYDGADVLAGGAGNDTLYGGGMNDNYMFTFFSGGQDYISDSSGEYDTVSVTGVANRYALEIHRATYYSSTNDANDIVIQRAGDTTLSEYIYIDNFYNGSALGAGHIEYLYVGGTNWWLSDLVT